MLTTLCATNPLTIDGRIMPSFDSLAFDDNGRVLAQLPFRGLASGCRTPGIDAGLFFLTEANSGGSCIMYRSQ